MACNKSEYCLDHIVLERKLPSGQAWFKAPQVNRDMSRLIFGLVLFGFFAAPAGRGVLPTRTVALRADSVGLFYG